jgi:prepilin-type N-terminal cleavage/methylation domain-containing protein
MRSLPRTSGMTILELAVVIVIIAILASMLLPIVSSFNSRAEEARCLANLRNLYLGASGYLQANNSWPQIANDLLISDPKKYAKLWVAALSPFGIPHTAWICPTIQRSLGLPLSEIDKDENYRVDYIGVAFDDQPASPHPEDPYPWFVEKAGFHGRGNLLILSNGTTTSLADLRR